jgi:catechol 2,3-dioxygenase-like lactoylglutathione lyase family enzyme
MINLVGTVSVFVSDQERAKDFYTTKLGFELRTDAPLYPWLFPLILLPGVALFAVGSISGALMDFLSGPSTVTVVVLTCLGILCFIHAAIELIRESALSLRVIEHHLEDIMVLEEESFRR